MAVSCYHCGKTAMYGTSHTHHRGVAGGRWKKRAQKTKRVFKPNLHKVTIMEAGVELRVKVCSKCLKRVKYDMDKGKKPFLHVIHYHFKPADLENDEENAEEIIDQLSEEAAPTKVIN